MAIPNYMNINRPEGIQQQIVTLIQYVERYYPEYIEVVREIILNYVPVDTQKIILESYFYKLKVLIPAYVVRFLPFFLLTRDTFDMPIVLE